MDLRDALARFDRRITLVGNVDQITFLRTARPDEVRRRAREILDLFRRAGQIRPRDLRLPRGRDARRESLALADAVRAVGKDRAD